MKKVKITVKRIACYKDLIDEYENPILHTCSMKLNDTFIANGWDTISPFVMALSHGATNLYDGWMKNEKSAMISCNDGFRPVSFYLEALDIDAD